MVPRENKNNAYTKFGGTNKEYYGIFRTGLLKRCWELDAIGILSHQEHQRTVEEEDAVNQFNSSCRFDGERYEVGLPWKKDYPPLVDNYGQAFQRLSIH